MNLNVLISAIVAASSVTAPIFTTLINNKHQLKMKKLELEQKHYDDEVTFQKNIFNEYLHKAGLLYGSGFSKKALEEYGDAYAIALLYAPEEIRKLMIKANNFALKEPDWKFFLKEIEELAPKIQEHISKL